MALDPGTERLYADLHRLHEARALRTAFALLGDRAAAEDATQEAFVQAFRTLPRKREDVAFATWLYRCLVWAVGETYDNGVVYLHYRPAASAGTA